MTINSKVKWLVFGPPLFWWIPSLYIALGTHTWKGLLLPFMGFYPGPMSIPGYDHYLTLKLTLAMIWGTLSLVAFAAVAFCALRKNSQAIALICALLISLSSLLVIGRVFWIEAQMKAHIHHNS